MLGEGFVAMSFPPFVGIISQYYVDFNLKSQQFIDLEVKTKAQ
jgi:hypothetical protein